MSPTDHSTIRHRLESVIALANLMERLDHSPTAVDPQQYQWVAGRLKTALDKDLPNEVLQAVLSAHPGAAEVYENLHYAHSGLSRSPLDRSVSSEQLATQVIGRLSRAARAG